MRPESSGSPKIGEGCLLVGEGAEEGSCQLYITTPPGGQPAGPVGHMRVGTAYANAMPGLPNGLVINTEDEIGMRNLASKLRLFLLCQIASVTFVFDHF